MRLTRLNRRSALHAAFLALLLGCALAPSSHAAVRITQINGEVSLTNHAASIQVQPGDNVSLVADNVEYDAYGNARLEDRPAGEFVWQAETQFRRESCDGATTCAGTHFQVTPYGVYYEFPTEQNERSVRITVQHKLNWSTSDQLELTAAYASQPQQPYPQPDNGYSSPVEYPTNRDFDYNVALSAHGRWVYVANQRVFLPNHYRNDWQPYQHGRWYWSEHGWTWLSYDPWGWVTDHYGTWRHHNAYGWVWMPFRQARWVPAAVSWFHTPQGIGWYPYMADAADSYRFGYQHGYDDGFWEGYRVGLNANYNWGWTFVMSTNFLADNIFGARHIGFQGHVVYNNAFYANAYGAVLRDSYYTDPRVFVSYRIGRAVPEWQLQSSYFRCGGVPVRWVYPRQVNLPNDYGQVWRRPRPGMPGGRPVPAPLPPPYRPQPRYPAPAPVPRYPAPAPVPRYPAPAPRPQYPAPAPRPQYPAPAPAPRYPAPGPTPRYPAPAPQTPRGPVIGPRQPGGPVGPRVPGNPMPRPGGGPRR